MLYVTLLLLSIQWLESAELRKGLDVDIASAMASEASDKTAILNSLRVPRAGTKTLQQEAPAEHESNLMEVWNISDFFLSDFFSPLTESTHCLCVSGSQHLPSTLRRAGIGKSVTDTDLAVSVGSPDPKGSCAPNVFTFAQFLSRVRNLFQTLVLRL